MGHLARVLRPSGPTHGRPPCSFPQSPQNDSDRVPSNPFENRKRCTKYVHLIGVAPDSHTKSPQELIRESNLENTNRCT
jgi:hypothetical protein